MKKRNIAIIAHVDHGKTTLVDKLLQKSGTFRDNENIEERVMDSNAIERERGITILAKPTAIKYQDYVINILDTPGHADFGGEVERIMTMVDGVLLVVDAFEGPMPQTRFVLKKALEAKVKPIVVVNKVDRPMARVLEVIDKVLDLFIELGADESQLEFPVAYVSALNGTMSLDSDLSTQQESFDSLFDMIIKEIPAPNVNTQGSFLFQPTLLDYNDFVGRIGIGRVLSGKVKVGESVNCIRLDSKIDSFRIQKMFGYFGTKRVEIQEAEAGDIIAIAGLVDMGVGETICSKDNTVVLEPLRIDCPTLEMTFSPNSSPFVGSEGKILTARKIEERLFKEMQRDVSLRVAPVDNSDSLIVSGRGELHLSILIENMRREGFEIEVSKPKVIIKEENGIKCEPYEELLIDIPDDCTGTIIESLGNRGAELVNMSSGEGNTRLSYVIPSRGLIGYMTDFMTYTKGYGIINHNFLEYREMSSFDLGERSAGVLVAMEQGKATAYALGQLEERGVMFIEPGQMVYEGMIVGESNRDGDLVVNVTKGKQLTNMRAAGSDKTTVLKRPRKLTIESALDYINSDELVEITPTSFRLRKKILNANERKRYNK